MKLFDWENKLSMDTCAQKLKDTGNVAYMDYNLQNFYGPPCESKSGAVRAELVSKYPNLRYREGYGVASGCAIDADSDVRLVAPTHGPERRQLFTRNFKAVPAFNRGCLDMTTVESVLKNGESEERQCGHLAESDFDRFTPLTPCMKDWVKGHGAAAIPVGANTREIWRCQSKNIYK